MAKIADLNFNFKEWDQTNRLRTTALIEIYVENAQREKEIRKEEEKRRELEAERLKANESTQSKK